MRMFFLLILVALSSSNAYSQMTATYHNGTNKNTVEIQSLDVVPDAVTVKNVKKVKNVIMLIGDGMGFEAVTAARIVAHGKGKGLSCDRFPVLGQSITYSLDKSLITDSAASGTALASGERTYNGMIGLDADKKPISNIADLAHHLGKSTGIVAVCDITHATPAAYAAHVKTRDNQWEIAKQMADVPLEVMLGGGRQYFLPGGDPGSKRDDDLDLVARMKKQGKTVVFTEEELDALNLAGVNNLVGLFASGHLDKVSDNRRPVLKKMTETALDILSRNKKGFFLMVEGSQIDWGGHANDLAYNSSEMLDFDETVGMVLDWAEKDGETLVVVTADHETGGLALIKADTEQKTLSAGWSTGDHTANVVPVFAYGPNSEAYAGTLFNFHIPQIAVQGWGVKNYKDFAYERY